MGLAVGAATMGAGYMVTPKNPGERRALADGFKLQAPVLAKAVQNKLIKLEADLASVGVWLGQYLGFPE